MNLFRNFILNTILLFKKNNKLGVLKELNNNLKLERFSLFHKYIIETYKRIIKTELKHIDIWFNNSIDKYRKLIRAHRDRQ